MVNWMIEVNDSIKKIQSNNELAQQISHEHHDEISAFLPENIKIAMAQADNLLRRNKDLTKFLNAN